MALSAAARPRNYWCFTHIVDRQGKVAGYLDHPIPEGPEKRQFVFTEAQKGEIYSLRLGVFDRASGQRLTITSSDFPLTNANTAANREVIYSWLTSFHVLSGLKPGHLPRQRGGVGSQILLVENALVD